MDENVSFSHAETCMIMEPRHTNAAGNVHGGELMKIMDDIAGITAFKHAKGNVVTARVDELVFHRPVHVGDIITCSGQLTYVGTSSMQVMVTLMVNDLHDDFAPEVALTAFFTMVHLVNDKPAKVEPLVPSNEEEEDLYRLGERKYKEIKNRFM